MANLELLRRCAKTCLAEWPALQLAVANGQGGPKATEKVEWMSEVLVDLFKENNDIHPDEVEDYLSEILNNEFDTIIEDGSLEFASALLCKYYSMIANGREEEVTQIVTDKEVAIIQKVSTRLLEQQAAAQQMDSLKLGASIEDTDTNISDALDDGWKVISRKRKH